MIEVNVKNLKTGSIVAENVVSPLGGVIVYKGTRIEEQHKQVLTAFTIGSIKIEEEKKPPILKPTPTKPVINQDKKEMDSSGSHQKKFVNEEFEKHYRKASSLIKKVMQEVEFTKNIPLLEIRATIKPMLEQICDKPDLSLVMNQLRANEEYTYQHLIGVGLISTLIGKFMNYKENELMQIGLAGTLHDIGKARIEDRILRKKGPLSRDEYEEIKKHPIYSYEFLKNVTGINQGVVLAALEHHEREDGMGYPYKRKGFEIHPYAKIVAVADIFHAMTSNRDYKDAENVYHVLKQISEDAFGKLDPQVVTKLINGLVSYCVGKKVKLTNGTEGEIIFINNNTPLKPLVKVGNDFIDLSRRNDVMIEQMSMYV